MNRRIPTPTTMPASSTPTMIEPWPSRGLLTYSTGNTQTSTSTLIRTAPVSRLTRNVQTSTSRTAPTSITPRTASALRVTRHVQTSTSRTAPTSRLTRNEERSTPRTLPTSRLTINVHMPAPRTVPASTLTVVGVVRNRVVPAPTSTPTVYERTLALKRAVESLPRVVIRETEGKCAICLEEWCAGETAAELPCKHKYHFECVKKWLMIHATCPECRYKMVKRVVNKIELNDDDSSSSSSDSDSSVSSDSDSDE